MAEEGVSGFPPVVFGGILEEHPPLSTI